MSSLKQSHTGDLVLPVRFLDQNEVFQKISFDHTYRFDDVLDVEKLRSALNRLLQIGKWGQLGARYKRNVSLRPQANFNWP
jgi:hypothetical protein